MPIDKQLLYGTFLESSRRQQKLADLATRKALDLPLDDQVNIHTQNGVSAKQLLALAAAIGFTALASGGGVLGVLAASGIFSRPANSPPAVRPATEEYDVTFWTEDGKPIEVTPRPNDRSDLLPRRGPPQIGPPRSGPAAEADLPLDAGIPPAISTPDVPRTHEDSDAISKTTLLRGR